MTATPIDLAITLLLLFVLFTAGAGGILALPWSDEELEASARAARSLRALPRLVTTSLVSALKRSVPAAGVHPAAIATPAVTEAV